MGSINGTISETGLTSASGSSGVVTLSNKALNQQTMHQLALINGGGASGTVPVKFIPKGGSVAEVLYQSDGTTAESFDLADLHTIKVEGLKVDAWVLDLSGITGGCDALVESW